MRIDWEYVNTHLPKGQELGILNEWGKTGWELVTIDTKTYTAYFKRPLASR